MDKWLWAVRLYKTRKLATTACAAGKVRINNLPVKPARSVHVGEVITLGMDEITRTVKVLAPLGERVGAKRVPLYLEDLTPASEYEKRREKTAQPSGIRPKGTGRPTKKDRRLLQSYFGDES